MRLFAGLLASLLVALAGPSAGRASGAYVGLAGDATTATDHRVIVALADGQTTVWDQIQYSGPAEDFVWLLPTLGSAAQIEIASPTVFTELEALTRPELSAPRGVTAPGFLASEGGAGCSGAPTSIQSIQPFSDVVTVFHQGDVGPYEWVSISVTPGADDDAAAQLDAWLRPRGFGLPASLGPALRDYAALGYVFNLLRLRGGPGASQVAPVRATYPGRQTTLPLRLVAVGAAEEVNLTVWVIAAQRQAAAGYDTVIVDESRLRWDSRLSRSTYRELFRGTIAAHGGRAFVTEYAQPLMAQALSPGADRTLIVQGQAGSAQLTRLRTTIAPSLLDADLVLVDSSSQTTIDNHHFLTAAQVIGGTSSVAGTAGFFGLLLAALRLVRRRR